MATRTEIAELYVATFNRAADADGLAYWISDGTPDTTVLTDLEDIAIAMIASPEYSALYAGLDREATIIEMYSNLFNRTVDGTDAGVQYWATGDGASVGIDAMIIALINGADTADKATLDAKTTVGLAFADAGLNDVSDATTVMSTVTSDAATVAAALDAIEDLSGVTGDTFQLTSGTDRGTDFTGTDAGDQFEAFIAQNPFSGGVSNTLSSADRLDGGAGIDTLTAEIVPEFFGATGDNQIDIQPRTADIENVTFEARDSGSNDVNDNTTVTVDAKYMTGLDKIGSKNSDGDLIIENLTTLDDNGNARNTEALTITMDHTDNFNSDTDASDLTVYFDEDYLLAGQSVTESQANYWMLDEDSLDYVTQPLLNIERDGVTLSIDGTEYTIAMESDVAATKDTWEAFAAGLQAVIDASSETAFEGLTVVVDETNTDSTFNDAGAQVTIPAITFIDAQGRDLTPTGFVSPADATGAFDIYGRFDNVASDTIDKPVTVNVEIEKAGREGEGGNLIIGGKELDNDGGAQDQGMGIDTFNISVLGDAARLSNVGLISSTNGALRTVNIATVASDVTDVASLTVRDAFGGTLDRVNANAFLGDLNVGQDTAAVNIDAFTATGGGDVTLVENLDGTEQSNYTVITGAGEDNITVDVNGDAVDSVGTSFAINTGAANDTVTVTGSGEVSDNTTLDLQNLSITTGAGEDKVNLNAEHIYMVNTDAGSDFVAVDADNAVGAPNGTLGTWSIGDGTGTDATDGDWDARVLYEATLTVDFAGFTETVVVNTTAANNFVATQEDINDAVIQAISDNSELSRLLTTEVGTGSENNQMLTITSTIQGANDLSIQVIQPEVLTVGPAAANQVVLNASHHAALEAGLIETGVIDSTAIPTNTAAEVKAVIDTIDGNLTETGAAGSLVDFVLDAADGTDGTNNTAATSRAIIDMGTGANDLVALDSDEDSADTLVFDTTWNNAANKVSILNFFDAQFNDVAGVGAVANSTTITHTGEVVGDHILDFTAWLDDQDTTSGSSASALREPTALDTTDSVTTIDLSSNLVSIITDFGTVGTEDFAGLTASELQVALNGAGGADDYANITTVATDAPASTNALVGTTFDSILLIESDINDGEYKVFNVETSDVGGTETYAVTELGTLDFGESIDATIALANIA